MKLLVTEKNIAAEKLANILADTKPKKDKVYSTPVYRFTYNGDEWVAIGLKGHILGAGFPTKLLYAGGEWEGVTVDGEIVEAGIPDTLRHPPFESNRRPFSKEGVDLKSWSIPALPYLTYAPVLMEPAEKELIRSLKNLAAKSDLVVIGTDFDREGELIGFDAARMVRQVNPDVEMLRARYSAITKEEITTAFESLTTIDEDLAKAGDSRRQIDLIWGAVLTRYLSKVSYGGFGQSRSAGRVQTPTLALIVERERERMAFIPEDYWTIKGQFKAGDTEFVAKHKTERFKVEAEARAAMKALEGKSDGTVTDVEKKSRKQQPPTPFNTTSLQAAAASEGISPARTMRIAESLYMNGLISYPRVDNTVYPSSLDTGAIFKGLKKNPAYAAAVDLITSGPLHPTRGKKETTDHPPIHPTGAPAIQDKMRPEEWKLYNLVARRFMATFLSAAVVEGTKASIDVGGETFVARGSVVVSPGFRMIYPYGLKKDDQLPMLEADQVLDFLGAEFEAKQTEPPARYSQGKLIQEMEARGLGTKATRHSMIERLYEVRYAQNDPVEPTQLGIAVIDALSEYAPRVTMPTMTADLEEEMNEIAEGKITREQVVGHSRNLLAKIIEDLTPRAQEMGERLSEAVTADARVGACPKCGKDLLMKSSRKTRSNFIGCSGWSAEEGEGCDVTFPVPQGKIQPVEEVCETCGSPQIKVTAFRSKPRIACVDPMCKTNYEPDVEIDPCPTCAEAGREGKLIAQRNPRTLKRFIKCTNYDDCGVSYPLPSRGKVNPTHEKCDACGSPEVVIDSGRGPWRICVNMECPKKEEAAKKTAAAKGGAKKGAKKPAAKKATTKRATTKKTTAKKATVKKSTAKKSATK